ncbi:MAG: sulfatase-like hydrolase/transferase [Thalassotalea sp.]
MKNYLNKFGVLTTPNSSLSGMSRNLRLATIVSSMAVAMFGLSACNDNNSAVKLAENTVKLEQQENTTPNVVFILVDDLGFGQVGFNGQTQIKTPNLDSLAKKGVQFTQAYAGSTVCSPSRISLLTGKDGRGLSGNNNTIKMLAEDVTFPQLLQKAGYETALIGKYGIGLEIGKTDPLAKGFDNWYGFLDNVSAHRQYPKTIMRNNQEIDVPENHDGKNGAYAQAMFTEEAISFINKKHDKPFFLYLSYTSPHGELAAPEEFMAEYENAFTETPYLGLSDGTADTVFERFYPTAVLKPNATMAAMITGLDQYIGQVLAEIEKAGLAENTLIIFTSDNGPHEESGADPEYFSASKPYRGMKRDLFDGGIHVPMVAYWQGKTPAGFINNTPIAFADFLPSFADMAGVSLAEHAVTSDGDSIYPLLIGDAETMPQRILYWEFVRELGGEPKVTQALRSGDYKAVRYGKDAKLQLFNIITDPAELNDLSEQDVELAAKYTAMFNDELNN